MECSYACQPGDPRIPNEDHVLASDRFVLVLDGATPAPGIPSGCVHDVPWLVATLGGVLARRLSTRTAAAEPSLVDVLRAGIADVMAAHGPDCDLTNRDSPSSTVAMIRIGDHALDYLVLGDSPIVIEHRDGALDVVLDDRTARLESYTRSAVSAARNSEGGFWVASTVPEAAEQALVGSVPLAGVGRVALFTDGASRLVERYGRSWTEALDLLTEQGPARLLAAVRFGDATTPAGTYSGKPIDDATAVLCTGLRGGSRPDR
jgi:hypothetical protein